MDEFFKQRHMREQEKDYLHIEELKRSRTAAQETVEARVEERKEQIRRTSGKYDDKFGKFSKQMLSEEELDTGIFAGITTPVQAIQPAPEETTTRKGGFFGLFKSSKAEEKKQSAQELLMQREDLKARAFNKFITKHEKVKKILEKDRLEEESGEERDTDSVLAHYKGEVIILSVEFEPSELLKEREERAAEESEKTPEAAEKEANREAVQTLLGYMKVLKENQGAAFRSELIRLRKLIIENNIYSGTIADEELRSDHAMKTETMWVFLMQAVSRALFSAVNKLDEQDVDIERFIELYGLSRNIDYVAMAMCRTKAYLKYASQVDDTDEKVGQSVLDMVSLEEQIKDTQKRVDEREREYRENERKQTNTAAVKAWLKGKQFSGDYEHELIEEKVLELLGETLRLKDMTQSKVTQAVGQEEHVYTDVLTEEASGELEKIFQHKEISDIRETCARRVEGVLDGISSVGELVGIVKERFFRDSELMRRLCSSSAEEYEKTRMELIAAYKPALDYVSTLASKLVVESIRQDVVSLFVEKHFSKLHVMSARVVYAQMNDMLERLRIESPRLWSKCSASPFNDPYGVTDVVDHKTYYISRISSDEFWGSTPNAEYYKKLSEDKDKFYKAFLEAVKSGALESVGLKAGSTEADFLELPLAAFEEGISLLHYKALQNAGEFLHIDAYHTKHNDELLPMLFYSTPDEISAERFRRIETDDLLAMEKRYGVRGFVTEPGQVYSLDSVISRANTGETRADRRSDRLERGRSLRQLLESTARGQKLLTDGRNKILEIYGESLATSKTKKKGDASVESGLFEKLNDALNSLFASRKKDADFTEEAQRFAAMEQVSAISSKKYMLELFLGSYEPYLSDSLVKVIEQEESPIYIEKQAELVVRLAGLEKKAEELYAATLREEGEPETSVLPKEFFEYLKPRMVQLCDKRDQATRETEFATFFADAYKNYRSKGDFGFTIMEMRRERRLKELREALGEDIEMFYPILFRDEKRRAAFYRADTKEFNEIVDVLRTRVVPVIRTFNGTLSGNRELIDTFLKIYGEQIYAKSTSVEYWKAILIEYRDKHVGATDDANKKVFDRMNELLLAKPGSKYYPLHDMAAYIVSREPLATFRSRERFESVMELYLAFHDKVNQAALQYAQKRLTDSAEAEMYAGEEEKARFTRLFTQALLNESMKHAQELDLDKKKIGDIKESELLGVWIKCLTLDETSRFTTETAYRVMERRHEVAGKIIARHAESEDIGNRELGRYSVVSHLLRGRVTPVVQMLGTKSGSFHELIETKKVTKAKTSVEERVAKYESDKETELSVNLRDLLVELKLAGKELSDEYMEKLERLEAKVKGEVTSLEVGTKAAQERTQRELLRFAVIYEAAEPDFEKVKFVYYDRRQALGKLRHIREITTAHPSLRAEYEMFEQEASYTLFTEATDTYIERVNRKVYFFNNAIKVLGKIAETFKETTGQDMSDQAQNGFLSYYRPVLLTSPEYFETEAFSKELRQLITDKDAFDYIEKPDGRITFIDRYSAETDFVKTSTIEVVTEFITKVGSASQRKRYQTLDPDERQLFALILTIPQIVSDIQVVPGMDVVDGQIQSSVAADRLAMVEAFMKGEKIEPAVNYAQAFETLVLLQKDKTSVSEVAFNRAFEMLSFLRKQRRMNLVDFERNGAMPGESVRLMRGMATGVDSIFGGIDTSGLTVGSGAWFAGKLEVEKVPDRKLLDRLSKLSDADMGIFMMGLRNRTVLDYSHTVSRWDRSGGEITERVNEEGREELIRAIIKGGSALSATEDVIEHTLMQLCSYRVKEDAVLTDSPLRFGDLDEESRKRKTVIDWELLGEAIKFVEEVKERRERATMLSQSADEELVRTSGVTRAVKALDKVSEQGTEEKLTAFFTEQAQTDHQEALLAGYLLLTPEERTLFIKAMGNRNTLDISKKDIWLNRFGLAERDYVDKEARDELLDTYLQDGKISLTSKDYVGAFISSLSTQLDDTRKVEAKQSLAQAQVSRGVGKKVRQTAIDWKLFTRALQIVTRARNEKMVVDREKHLFKVYGKVDQTGEYVGAHEVFRGNIHNSGVAFTRMLGSLVVESALDAVPSYVQRGVRLLLPIEASNKLNSLKPFEKEDEDSQSLVSTAAEAVTTLNTYVNEDVLTAGLVDILAEKVHLKAAREKLGSVSDKIETISTVKEIVGNVVDLGEMAVKTAGIKIAADKEAQEETREASKEKSPEEQRTEEARKALASDVDSALTAVTQEKVLGIIEKLKDQIELPFEDLGEIVGPFLLDLAFNTLSLIVTAATDHARIRKHFKIDEATAAYSKVLKDADIDWKSKGSSTATFCKANGFEKEAELGEQFLMNMAHSLVFAASEFNQASSKQKLISILCIKKLGLGKLVGNISEAAATEVYEKLRERRF